MRIRRFLVLLAVLVTPVLSFAETEKKPILLGIDALEARGFDVLQGKQIGLITNQTGVDSRGESTADILAKAPRVRLVALFSPEHGIRGTIEHGQQIGDALDPELTYRCTAFMGLSSVLRRRCLMRWMRWCLISKMSGRGITPI